MRKRAAKVPISSERVYYRFSGEYWTDELPHYKFNIEDRCVDDTTASCRVEPATLGWAIPSCGWPDDPRVA